MVLVEQKLDTISAEPEKKEPRILAPIYQELLAVAPKDPDFENGKEGIRFPSNENRETYLQMANYLKERFAGMETKEEKLEYLGMVAFTGGKFEKGTETPTPDKRMGARFNETPEKDVEVPYKFHLSTTVVPNILYEIAVADMGGYQVRINQSPSHLHPAVNANQENAVKMVSWLGKVSALELRLPTEDEWDFATAVISDGREFIYGKNEPVKGSAKTFDPEEYHTISVDQQLAANSIGIVMGGNVWEMTTPDLEIDFKRIPSNNTTLVDGYSYAAKGGGFQHCSLGPRRGPRMMCDPLLRSPSLGFRLALSETREENPYAGWRKRTIPQSGHVLYKEMSFPESALQVVQTNQTQGLSFILNGEVVNVRPDNLIDPKPPARSIGLTNGKATLYQTEHLLAALNGLGIWNARAIIDGGNAPPADYSAEGFVKRLQERGLYPGACGLVEITEEVKLENGSSYCILKPGSPRFDVEIDFTNPFIGKQNASFDPIRDDFASEIAPARTFRETVVDEEEWSHQRQDRLVGLPPFERLNESPLLVATPEGWQTPLRFANEPARHKLLDTMGDLALLGLPIKGHISFYKPGHSFNLKVVREIHNMLRSGDSRVRLTSL